MKLSFEGGFWPPRGTAPSADWPMGRVPANSFDKLAYFCSPTLGAVEAMLFDSPLFQNARPPIGDLHPTSPALALKISATDSCRLKFTCLPPCQATGLPQHTPH